MKTYIASYAVSLYSSQMPVRIPIHVPRWLFPAFFARRRALSYGKRRSWTLIHLKPLP